jgi:hypothetical protein
MSNNTGPNSLPTAAAITCAVLWRKISSANTWIQTPLAPEIMPMTPVHAENE